ncbi:PHB depolymerase family esterase [Nocardia puris]|uniref:Poly(Hydroxyalkanoate) depolymerase family esterase n=1 Tax=Nocardia puris TaxID=208602 RepID=A0A366DS19_9NOCA|nr:PHB depolymerase family esterase [Nocardia puris]MBF6215285.1 PHB depolymerase family esterase [Nocardia puris]RBO92891.1 poly(hydroxyalkanoate) depolymerase family esterase [Nocardia puris]
MTRFAHARRPLSVVVLTLLVGALALLGAPHAGAAEVERRTYSGATGARDYYLHVPAGPTAGKPLMIYLHGCTEPERQLAGTGFALTRLADELGFVLAYPLQDRAANERWCWNWYDTAHQRRGDGEAALIAGLTTALAEEFGLDRSRVYVGGYSAGGGMSTVLGAGYPDLYAAIAPMAGGPYAPSTRPMLADLTGASIVDAMGERARPMPALFLQDLADQTSVYPLGRANLAQWLAAGRRAGLPVANTPSAVTTRTDPVPTTVEHYRVGDCEIARFLTPVGPDHIAGGLMMQSEWGLPMQREMMDFLLSHRLAPGHTACG